MNRRDLFKGVLGASIARAIPLPAVAKIESVRKAGNAALTPAMVSREAARILNEQLRLMK